MSLDTDFERDQEQRASQLVGATIRDLFARLYAVRRAAQLYPVDHPAVLEPVEALGSAVRTLHAQNVSVSFAFFDGEITLGATLLAEESVLFDQLVRDLNAAGIGRLGFAPAFQASELARAVPLLAADSAEIERRGGLAAWSAAAGLANIDIGEAMAFERSGYAGTPDEMAHAAYDSALDLMRELDTIVLSERIDARHVRGTVRSLVDQVTEHKGSMLKLSGLRSHDEYTFYHSANVAILSVALGSTISTDARFLSSLGTGALMHDVGKLVIPREILNKPGALSAEEWGRMRDHPVEGAQVAAAAQGLDRSAVVTILEHHMRFDGEGYPELGRRTKQRLTSRIVAVADSYDAMTSLRSYSAARPQDEAMEMLVRAAGTSLDPALVRLFVKMMGVYPPRTVVRLDTGEVAIVLEPRENHPVRPLVRVIATADGSASAIRDVDLAASGTTKVVGCVDPRQLRVDVEDYL